MKSILPGTAPLETSGDLAAEMVAGIDRFLMRETERVARERDRYWRREVSSPEAYSRSVGPNRRRLAEILGLSDPRLSPDLRIESRPGQPAVIARGPGYQVYAARWSVLRGVEGEGLLLLPDGDPAADVVAAPDCDWTPEMLAGLTPGVSQRAQFAARLAENGCRVLIPALIDRSDTHSGLPGVKMTNQPHREFIHRAAYEMGRTMPGYEVQKILAGVDWLSQTGDRPIGVIGYGEGGLLAFYAAAMDERITAAVVSGYFQPREALWSEPYYRNLFGLLEQFGDAEIASLAAPRALIIETSDHPEVPDPVETPGRSGATPGHLTTPPFAAVKAEFTRAHELASPQDAGFALVQPADGLAGSDAALSVFLTALGSAQPLRAPGERARLIGSAPAADQRLERQFRQLMEHVQLLVRESPYRREEFWARADVSDPAAWEPSTDWHREYFWDEVIGRLPPATAPTNPRSRLLYETPRYRGYEVTLDVYPNVFAAGILLVPVDAAEPRPVVVCQHGLEGRPQDAADPEVDNHFYHRFACRLADEGYVVYAPQNPYIGGDAFRVLQRKAQPLKKTLFSVVVRQHERTLEWLSSLPFVDPGRIGFYGLSYGGYTAMRVPSLLKQYCLAICSANFNEWIWKTTSISSRYSYLLTQEYDMPEWNLGDTFNYAEMSGMIAPRPFMVERGHTDNVAPDEWVTYEYARTKRLYDLLGIGGRTVIEVFDGGHEINGKGTFAFLREWLRPDQRAGGPTTDSRDAGANRGS